MLHVFLKAMHSARYIAQPRQRLTKVLPSCPALRIQLQRKKQCRFRFRKVPCFQLGIAKVSRNLNVVGINRGGTRKDRNSASVVILLDQQKRLIIERASKPEFGIADCLANGSIGFDLSRNLFDIRHRLRLSRHHDTLHGSQLSRCQPTHLAWSGPDQSAKDRLGHTELMEKPGDIHRGGLCLIRLEATNRRAMHTDPRTGDYHLVLARGKWHETSAGTGRAIRDSNTDLMVPDDDGQVSPPFHRTSRRVQHHELDRNAFLPGFLNEKAQRGAVVGFNWPAQKYRTRGRIQCARREFSPHRRTHPNRKRNTEESFPHRPQPHFRLITEKGQRCARALHYANLWCLQLISKLI